MISTTLIYLALSHLAAAQNATGQNSTGKCTDAPNDVYTSFNKTGTNNIPGFQPPNTSPSNWTLNFGVSDTRNATDKSSRTDMYMWINSTDNNTELNSPELPYTGCFIGVVLDRKRTSTGSFGDGDGCEGVFSEKCYNALVAHAKSRAQMSSDNDDYIQRCISYNVITPEGNECADESQMWSTASHGVIFGNGTAGTDGSDGCGEPGVTKGAQLRSPAWINSGIEEDSYDNHTYYDSVVENASIFFLTASMKNSSDDSQVWGDARLVCATPGGIKQKSPSIPSATGTPSAAARGLAWNFGVGGMMAVAIALVLSSAI